MKVELKDNEIAIGNKEIFSIPNKNKIRLINIKEALLAKQYGLEEIENCLRQITPLSTYVWSAVNIFANHNELTVYADTRDEEMVRRMLELFQRSFKCKTPYGEIHKVKDLEGNEILKLTLVRNLL